MFVRGGVYRVVKEAMGGALAKFSVSALMFDYILQSAAVFERLREHPNEIKSRRQNS